MRAGGALVLFAIGAIITFAVERSVSGVDLDVVGIILMVVGLIGVMLALVDRDRYWDR